MGLRKRLKQFATFGLPRFATRGGNPERRAILESNKALREGREDKPKHLSFGGVSLRIPELDYAVIQRMFPDVMSPDHEIRTKGWQDFARSPLSEPYRVHRKTRGPQCRSLTAR